MYWKLAPSIRLSNLPPTLPTEVTHRFYRPHWYPRLRADESPDDDLSILHHPLQITRKTHPTISSAHDAQHESRRLREIQQPSSDSRGVLVEMVDGQLPIRLWPLPQWDCHRLCRWTPSRGDRQQQEFIAFPGESTSSLYLETSNRPCFLPPHLSLDRRVWTKQEPNKWIRD